MKTLYQNSFTIFREEADGELVDPMGAWGHILKILWNFRVRVGSFQFE